MSPSRPIRSASYAGHQEPPPFPLPSTSIPRQHLQHWPSNPSTQDNLQALKAQSMPLRKGRVNSLRLSFLTTKPHFRLMSRNMEVLTK